MRLCAGSGVFFDVPVSVASILRVHRIVSKQLLTLGVRGSPAFQPAVGKMNFFRKANTASGLIHDALRQLSPLVQSIDDRLH